jgi:hemerythrin-like domain-containing protein
MTAERVAAWGRELRAVHQRLRDALEVAREAVEAHAEPESVSRDLQLFCRGFCAALDGHHRSEDRALFPLVLRRHPELAPVVAKLSQDHSMLTYLIQEFDHTLRTVPEEQALLRHLDGISAVMETHFRYEERQLVDVLDALPDEDLDRTTLLGEISS